MSLRLIATRAANAVVAGLVSVLDRVPVPAAYRPAPEPLSRFVVERVDLPDGRVRFDVIDREEGRFTPVGPSSDPDRGRRLAEVVVHDPAARSRITSLPLTIRSLYQSEES